MATSLYLVPTPIGNLDDITLRGIKILQSVDIILAEDTRKSGFLLKHLDISKPLRSFHAHNEHKVLDKVIQELKEGRVMALISDAGTPAISDPGFLLIRECLRNDITIECLPGATAFVPALVKSGLPSDRFIFEGFLPQKKGRKTRLDKLALEERTIILYESPHRLLRLLKELIEVMGMERLVSVSRELTKIYEETFNGTLTEALNYFEGKTVKGEIVVVLEGKSK